MISAEVVVLLSTISTGILALIGLCVRYSYLSKCFKVKICCLEYERDIKAEQEAQNIKNLSNDNSISNLNNV